MLLIHCSQKVPVLWSLVCSFYKLPISLSPYFAPTMSMPLGDFPPTLDRYLRPSVNVLWFSLKDPTAPRSICLCRGRRSSDIFGRTDGRTDVRNVRVGLFALSVDTEWDSLHPNDRIECGQLRRT